MYIVYIVYTMCTLVYIVYIAYIVYRNICKIKVITDFSTNVWV